ncbi:hypothetical protein SDJN03_12678, partial [Cucurbita argyrosperma subsp. sororia]
MDSACALTIGACSLVDRASVSKLDPYLHPWTMSVPYMLVHHSNVEHKYPCLAFMNSNARETGTSSTPHLRRHSDLQHPSSLDLWPLWLWEKHD